MLRASILASIMAAATLTVPGAAAQGRRVIRLDGIWRVAEGAMSQIPPAFRHRIPVPGLADLAVPRFSSVGDKAGAQRRQAFWYRRTFSIDGPVPPVAVLKIHKAMFGTRVYLNRRLVGDHLPCFTPGYFDLRPYLKGSGAENELTIRVGALPDVLPGSIPSGWDFEKSRYIPGIYDSVDLILSATPHVVRVQTVPDVAGRNVRIVAEIQNSGPSRDAAVGFTVREAASGRVAGRLEPAGSVRFERGETRAVEATIAIADCRLWSPEDPFLYELTTDLGTDALVTRFGVRSFSFDKESGRALLNGRPYALRGTNVCIYRFFEDLARGERPWHKDWVYRLHQGFKSMHWNSARYCIGFPPESWYDTADEVGLLIQDEFPIWHLGKENWPRGLTAKELIAEYTEWMQERWNHPSVVIWDAQNESVTEETGMAIRAVRSLDLSNRPWDNGWAQPQAPTDVYEAHPYAFYSSKEKREPTPRRLSDFASMPGAPGGREGLTGNVILNSGGNPVVINEYGWMWLNRDGTPTSLTAANYRAMLGDEATADQRRVLYARILAAKTEFWRAHRRIAGIMHFCALGYSRPDGETSDHFIDVEQLTFEPHFLKYVRDSFAPVGIMVDEWRDALPAGKPHTFKVLVTNDLGAPWEGEVAMLSLRGNDAVVEQSRRCRVPAYGQASLEFELMIPAEPGRYTVAGELVGSQPVRSYRDFSVSR